MIFKKPKFNNLPIPIPTKLFMKNNEGIFADGIAKFSYKVFILELI